ncbi:MAG: nucleotide-binding protein [Planctomycetota bacterium]|jgi:CO dehydrogenase maturation factor
MKLTIAVSGKGGVGKTTIAAIMIRELIARSTGPVLGVDADPNACLSRREISSPAMPESID